MLGVPYDLMPEGTYLPGQPISGNPHLTYALEEFQAAMYRHSCTLTGNSTWYECVFDESTPIETRKYSNHFSDDVMPDPTAQLVVEEIQPGLKKLTLKYKAVSPANPEEFLIDAEWVKYRHADSNYETECRFANKSC